MMLPELGILLLILALISSTTRVLRLVDLREARYVKKYVRAQLFLVFLSMLCLWGCIFRNDMALSYVALHSHSELAWYYKISALWGGHQGSLLLWAFIQQLYHYLLVSKLADEKYVRYLKSADVVMHAYSMALLLIILFTSNPFSMDIANLPIDGQDLNPMLQDFALIIHPPILYMGYVGSSALFALSIAVLKHGSGSGGIWGQMRFFSFLVWGMLGLGITLGSWWAYYELGWGGWWFWDPAENAALMPWISATILIHNLYLSRHKGAWETWTILVAFATFFLSIFGTFIIRSGLVSSVHSFSLDYSKARAFIGLLTILGGYAIYSWISGAKNLSQQEKLLFGSKEFYINIASVILSVLVFSIFLGTIYPLITQYLLNYEVSIGFPYFNKVFLLLMIPALLLMPFSLRGPKNRKLSILLISIMMAFCVCYFFYKVKWSAVLGLSISIFIIISEAIAFKRANIPRFGGHLAIAVITASISIVSNFEVEKEIPLDVGKSSEISNNNIKLNDISIKARSNHVAYIGNMSVGEHDVFPEKRYYFSANQATTEVSLMRNPFYDIYIAMSEKRGDNWIFRVSYKPMVRYMWLGGVIIFMVSLYVMMRRSRNVYIQK